jgi:TadE-like protein
MLSALRPRRRPRRPGERGAVAVEAALITPLLIMLVFGIIDFGFLFKDWLAVTSATRAGARIASAEARTATYATDAALSVAREGAALHLDGNTALWVYKAGTNGYPIGMTGFTSCPPTTCVIFKWSGSAFVKQTGSDWAYTSQDACQGEVDKLGVYLTIKDAGVTKMFIPNGKRLSSRTVMSFEPIPAGQSGGCK